MPDDEGYKLGWSELAPEAVRAALIALVPLLAFTDLLRIWQLYAIVLLVGVGTVFFELSYLSYLPSLVTHQQFVEGNSKLGASESAADVAGPGLAGLLVQVLKAPVVLLFDAASSVVSVVLLLYYATRKLHLQPSRDPWLQRGVHR